MAFRMANQFRRSAMKSRNFASAAAASEKGFVEKFVPVEVSIETFRDARSLVAFQLIFSHWTLFPYNKNEYFSRIFRLYTQHFPKV